MERDQDRWPADGPDDGGSGWDDDRPRPDYWDGRLTNEDFVDPPRDDAPRDPARPLYDGRPGRDPYERGGGYRRVSDAVWDRARDDYLDGDAAETVCARHGLALSTFRQRARARGWRRIDQPDPDPADLPIDMVAEVEAGLPDYADMACHALVRLNRAVLGGRVAEAAGWMRLHARLRALAEAEAAADVGATPPSPAPASVVKAAPSRRQPDMTDRISTRIKTLAEAVRTLKALREQPHPRAMDQFDIMLDQLAATPVSDDSHPSDGLFPPGESETGPAAPEDGRSG